MYSLQGIQDKNTNVILLTNFSLVFADDGNGISLKVSCKSNEKIFNKKYAALFFSWMPFSEICHILKKNAKIVETGKFIKVSWSTILTKKKEQTSMGCFKNNGLFIQLLTLTRCLFISHFVFRRQRVEFFFSTKAQYAAILRKYYQLWTFLTNVWPFCQRFSINSFVNKKYFMINIWANQEIPAIVRSAQYSNDYTIQSGRKKVLIDPGRKLAKKKTAKKCCLSVLSSIEYYTIRDRIGRYLCTIQTTTTAVQCYVVQ